jgi:hypothetical protein
MAGLLITNTFPARWRLCSYRTDFTQKRLKNSEIGEKFKRPLIGSQGLFHMEMFPPLGGASIPSASETYLKTTKLIVKKTKQFKHNVKDN